MELVVHPEILTSYIYIYMDLSLATLKAVSFCLLQNVSILNQCRTCSCVTVVCKHFANYQDCPNFKWDLTFRNRASYIQDGHSATFQKPHFIYFFNIYMYWIFLTCCTLSVFSLQNAVYFIMLHFLVPVLFAFYIQDVLKFKYQISVPKG
jgi:hypothetical protein